MRIENRRYFYIAVCLLMVFFLWTAAIQLIDVQAIGPLGATVGFASLNQFVHSLTGVHMALYTLTDWLSLVPLGFVLGFAFLGLSQWIQRKHLSKVNSNILLLGCFYAVVMAIFVLFEIFVVNYRPILIDGILEASYPSSTTMLVICVMQTAILQLQIRMQKKNLKKCVTIGLTAFLIFMVIGRLLSGVHWFTDIVGGILLSEGLVLMYRALIPLKVK